MEMKMTDEQRIPATERLTPGDMVAIRKALADQPHVSLVLANGMMGQAEAAAILVKMLQASGLVVGAEALAAERVRVVEELVATIKALQTDLVKSWAFVSGDSRVAGYEKAIRDVLAVVEAAREDT